MKKLLKYLRPYRKESILGPLFKLAEALLELLVPLAVAAIIDRGIRAGNYGYVFGMAGLLVLFGAVGLAFSVTAQYFAARAAVGFTARVRHALFSHIGRLSHTELDALGQSTMITRMTSDMNQIQNGLNLTLRLLLRSPFVVFGAMIMAFTVDPTSALIFVAVIPALSIVVFGVMLLSIPLYKKVQARLDGVTLSVRENLAGARVIRAFCREESEVSDFAEKNKVLSRTQRVAGRISALLNPLTFVLINLAIVYLIYTGAIRVEAGILTQGMVIALYNYMSQILVELIKLASLIITMTKSVACARRVSAVLDLPAGMQEGEGDLSPMPGAPAVSFAGATLSYRGAGAPAVIDATFHTMPGEVVGIIGGTGSGKSSLVAMIPRAYDANEGSVSVFGHDVREYSLAALRKKIGIVPQNVQLFRGSIRDNIKVGKKDATDEEIWAALAVAQAADFVREKEGGLDFLLEAGGKNLSGGQCQRLTIARALVRKPAILILDDSTSALDFATDAALRRALREEAGDATVFLVSQRTSSIRHADRIVVLDDGEIVGLGRHDDLLLSCPVYREIYDSQYKKEDVENA